jgi:hypothetical protein
MPEGKRRHHNISSRSIKCANTIERLEMKIAAPTDEPLAEVQNLWVVIIKVKFRKNLKRYKSVSITS